MFDRRLLGGAISALALIPTFTALTPSAAQAQALDECALDHGNGENGIQVIQVGDGTWTLDRFVLDADGRVLTIERRFNEDEFGQAVSISDRIRRFGPDGRPDPSFGIGGAVELPDEAYSGWSRNLAVGPFGEIWSMRATYRNQLEFRRFLPDGAPDPRVGAAIVTFLGTAEPGPIGTLHVRPDGIAEAVVAMDGSPDNDADGPASWVKLTTDRDGNVTQSTFGNQGQIPGDPLAFNLHRNDAGRTVVTGRTYYEEVTSDFSGVIMSENRYHHRVGTTYVDARPNGSASAFATGGTSVIGEDSDTVIGTYPLDSRLSGAPTVERRLDLGTNDFGVAIAGDLVFAMDEERDLHVIPYDFAADELGDILTIPNVGPSGAIWPSVARGESDGRWTFVTWTTPARIGQPLDKLAVVRSVRPGIEAPEAGALSGQIERLFSAYFLRSPDPDGRAYWLRQRAGGRTLRSISDFFVVSDEFEARYGDLSDEAFVRLVYQNVLGRQPDSAGLAYWTNQLTGGQQSRGEVMIGFSESSEYLGVTGTAGGHEATEGAVHRLYRAYFGRDSDRLGFCFWVGQLEAGRRSLRQISGSFAGSEEFTTRYGALDDSGFVELVYQNVLDRPPDAAGHAFWVAQLESNARTRGEVMLGFSESVEYVMRTDTLPD